MTLHTLRFPQIKPLKWIQRATQSCTFRHSLRLASWVAPEPTYKGLEKVFFRPLPLPLRHNDRAFLSQARHSESLYWGRGDLQVWHYGESGPYVVLIHGWGGRGVQLKKFVEPLLEQGFQVALFDLPAHGESTGQSTHLVECAEAISTLVNHLGNVQGFVAHSFGAASLALTLRNLSLTTPAAFVSPLGELTPGLRSIAARHGVDDKVFALFKDRQEELMGVSWDDQLCPYQTAHEQQGPLLLVHDKGDGDLSFTHSEKLKSKWPGSRILLTEGLGHFRILQNEHVIESIVEFIQEYRR